MIPAMPENYFDNAIGSEHLIVMSWTGVMTPMQFIALSEKNYSLIQLSPLACGILNSLAEITVRKCSPEPMIPDTENVRLLKPNSPS